VRSHNRDLRRQRHVRNRNRDLRRQRHVRNRSRDLRHHRIRNRSSVHSRSRNNNRNKSAQPDHLQKVTVRATVRNHNADLVTGCPLSQRRQAECER
jgi:hypothetical protein